MYIAITLVALLKIDSHTRVFLSSLFVLALHDTRKLPIAHYITLLAGLQGPTERGVGGRRMFCT